MSHTSRGTYVRWQLVSLLVATCACRAQRGTDPAGIGTEMPAAQASGSTAAGVEGAATQAGVGAIAGVSGPAASGPRGGVGGDVLIAGTSGQRGVAGRASAGARAGSAATLSGGRAGSAGSRSASAGSSAAVGGGATAGVLAMAGMPAAQSGAGGGGANAGAAGPGPSAGPCDIYASGNTPCVAAHSTVRALYAAYDGSLYQVRRASDNTTKDITVTSPGGFADAATQDAFCSATRCTISIIYDQSPRHNHLTKAPAGGAKRTPDNEASATGLRLTVSGHDVYAVYIDTGMGYRNNRTSGIATGDQPEGEYMVTSGKHYNGGCCFDYGNAETTNNDDGNGTMEAVYFGNCTGWGRGSGNGPWVMADLENGLFAGQSLARNDANTPLSYEYVTAMIKGRAGHFAIKGADAQSGALKTMYDGGRPTIAGYNPMKKQGAIILGIGGDNSNSAVGTFFEGAITSGYPTDAVDDAVQANIAAVGYGK